MLHNPPIIDIRVRYCEFVTTYYGYTTSTSKTDRTATGVANMCRSTLRRATHVDQQRTYSVHADPLIQARRIAIRLRQAS